MSIPGVSGKYGVMNSQPATTPQGQGPSGKLVALIVALALCVVGLAVVLVIVLMSRKPMTGLEERLPGMDRLTSAGGSAEDLSAISKGKLIKGDGALSTLPGFWPRFRGPNGDNIATDAVAIATQWNDKMPAKLWSVDLGEGYAGAAVRDGRVYILDYDQAKLADALRCLSLADGKEFWRFAYPVKTKRNHGMSRTVPTVTDKYVISLGPKCHVICLKADTGEFVWGIDLVKDFNAEIPQWYAGQCPLVDGDRVILAPGGDALMIAVDIATGKVLWRTPNPRDWKMTHSSIVPMEFGGKKMFVYCGSGGVAGYSADEGALLWETPDWVISIATVPSPIAVGDGKIFLSGGYNAGCMMLQLKEAGGKFAVEKIFRLDAKEFGATQQTPVLYQGNIYGIRPDGQLACLSLAGKILWTSGSAAKFGLGPLLIADGKILAMNDDGLLTLAEATPAKYNFVTKARVLNGHDSWAPMALAGGRLLARDLTQLVCLDITGAKP